MTERVTDKQFEQARNNPKNQSMIGMVCGYFAGALSEDNLKCCSDIALWRCLRKHKSGGKQAFTSSLYHFLRWECLNAIARDRKMRSMTTIDDMEVLCGFQDQSTIHNMMLQDYIKVLLPIEQRVVKGRLHKKTYQEIADDEGYSKQGIKYVYERAKQKMKEVVESGV